jgi:hypothetical protein
LSKPTLFPKIDDETNAKLQTRQDLLRFYDDINGSHQGILQKCTKVITFVYSTPFNHKWEPGVVKDKEQTPKSYILDMPSGSTLKRNRRHIRPSVESPNEGVGDNPSTSITATE